MVDKASIFLLHVLELQMFCTEHFWVGHVIFFFKGYFIVVVGNDLNREALKNLCRLKSNNLKNAKRRTFIFHQD